MASWELGLHSPTRCQVHLVVCLRAVAMSHKRAYQLQPLMTSAARVVDWRAESAKSQLLSYEKMLIMLERRFDMRQLRAQFAWKDAFKPYMRQTEDDARFERTVRASAPASSVASTTTRLAYRHGGCSFSRAERARDRSLLAASHPCPSRAESLRSHAKCACPAPRAGGAF